MAEVEMNCFKLVKSVLDEQYGAIPGKEAEKDEAIRKGLIFDLFVLALFPFNASTASSPARNSVYPPVRDRNFTRLSACP